MKPVASPPPDSPRDGRVVPHCPCGSAEFDVIYTTTVYVRVDQGAVTRVVVADESTGKPILTECSGCGSTDGEGCEVAGELAENAPEWPAWDIGG